MDAQNVVVTRRRGLQEVLLRGDAILQKPFINETVLLGRKNVRTEVQVISVIVNELERKHAASLSLNFSKRKLGRVVSAKYPNEYGICRNLCYPNP
jgi:hypothetical protein